jgi:hypothetical protein
MGQVVFLPNRWKSRAAMTMPAPRRIKVSGSDTGGTGAAAAASPESDCENADVLKASRLAVQNGTIFIVLYFYAILMLNKYQ